MYAFNQSAVSFKYYSSHHFLSPPITSKKSSSLVSTHISHVVLCKPGTGRLEELSNMAASAAFAAECERELYHLSDLQAKHHSTCIKHVMMRLQAIDIQLNLIHSTVYDLQRAVLQLQEDGKVITPPPTRSND